MEQHLLIHGVLWPCALALALILAWRSLRDRTVGLALALAFVASASEQDQLAAVPPEGSWTWLPVALAAAVVVGCALGRRGAGRSARDAICIVAALIAALLLPLPEWRGDDARLLLAGTLALHASLLLPLAMHRGGFSSWLAFSISIAGTSGVAMASGFAKLAVACGAFSAACGMVGVLALSQRPHRSLHAGIAGGIAIAGCATLGAATAFAFETAGIPRIAFLCVALAPLGSWLGEAPPFRTTPLASGIARVTGSAIIAGLGVWIAMSPMRRESNAYALRGDRPDAGMSSIENR